ncbi:type IV secretory system conjugative DNA transfer family protein [Nocardia carnea]|uniref:type IV secretory system conjugative DNA transfer family protein n=1 Tax=Nocardia carnea TaxID=37328 RepID=UPI000310AD2B|nr:TraM recognition domain-containing protein [Nocardia carnea]
MKTPNVPSSTDRPIYAGNSEIGFYAMASMLGLWLDATATVWLSLWLGGADPVNPLIVVLAWAAGRLTWTTAAIGWALVFLAAHLAALVWAVRRWRQRTHARKDIARRFDFVAQWMAKPSDVGALSREAGLATSARLGSAAWPGNPLGMLVTSRGTPGYEQVKTEFEPASMLYSGCEALTVDIWGPRRGKTTSRVIPAIVEAPGACVVTSNRRDVVDATRGVREKRRGGEVFVFDPQRITGPGEPQFCFDPLWAVTMDDREMWPDRAEKLADIFLANTMPPGARPDPFFDPEGRDLLARLFLAAAVSDQPSTRVYDWITEPTPQPLKHLQQSEFSTAAAALSKFIGYSARQKDGLFGTAKKMTNILSRPSVQKWVNATAGRPKFDPQTFVTTPSTLYILSKEGVDSAGALATALVWAVCDAAERYGERCGGRMPVPMVVPLDELANVIKWPDLPGKFSHYGGRGILMMAVLQNWSQGVNTFGAEGMQQLWDAASIRYYGGGVADEASLGKLSELIGPRWEIATSTNMQRPADFLSSASGHISVSRDTREHKILPVAHLSQLPRGRAVMLWDGKPALVRPVPYWDRPYAAQIQKSLATYAPKSSLEKPRPALEAAPPRWCARMLPHRAAAALPEAAHVLTSGPAEIEDQPL